MFQKNDYSFLSRLILFIVGRWQCKSFNHNNDNNVYFRTENILLQQVLITYKKLTILILSSTGSRIRPKDYKVVLSRVFSLICELLVNLGRHC